MPGAQRLDSARTAIDTYRVAIQLAQQAPARGQPEAAFNAIGPLRKALMLSPDGRDSTLESLSEQEFTTLSRELVGLIVNRDEIVFVEPDVVLSLPQSRSRRRSVHSASRGEDLPRRQFVVPVPHADVVAHVVACAT